VDRCPPDCCFLFADGASGTRGTRGTRGPPARLTTKHTHTRLIARRTLLSTSSRATYLCSLLTSSSVTSISPRDLTLHAVRNQGAPTDAACTPHWSRAFPIVTMRSIAHNSSLCQTTTSDRRRSASARNSPVCCCSGGTAGTQASLVPRQTPSDVTRRSLMGLIGASVLLPDLPARAVQGYVAGRIPGGPTSTSCIKWQGLQRSNVLRAVGVSTEADEAGFYTYRRPEGKQGGHGVGWSEIPQYSFKVPSGWEEVPVSIADLGGAEVGPPLYNALLFAPALTSLSSVPCTCIVLLLLYLTLCWSPD
jgi:hypothetical protein